MKEENRLWNEIKHRDVSTEFKNVTGGGGKAQRHAKGGISGVGPPFWELLQVTNEARAGPDKHTAEFSTGMGKRAKQDPEEENQNHCSLTQGCKNFFSPQELQWQGKRRGKWKKATTEKPLLVRHSCCYNL